MKNRVIIQFLSALVFLFFLFGFSFSQNVSKDVVYLKNGSIIKGDIIEQIPNKSFKIQTGDGNIFVYDAADIEKITIEKITNESNHYEGSPFDKGSSLLMGEFRFSSQGGDLYNNSSGDRLTTIEFNPSYGYFIDRGFLLAMGFTLASQSQGNSSYTQWSIGPTLGYFIGVKNSKSAAHGETYPFVEAGIQYLQSTSKTNNYSSTTSGSIIHFGGGVCHMISESVGLSGKLEYEIDKVSPENGSSTSGNQITFWVGMLVFIN